MSYWSSTRERVEDTAKFDVRGKDLAGGDGLWAAWETPAAVATEIAAAVGDAPRRRRRASGRIPRLRNPASRDQVSASAPATTSRISWVISAWRARFISSERLSIISPAFFEAFRIAVIRAPCSDADDSRSAR